MERGLLIAISDPVRLYAPSGKTNFSVSIEPLTEAFHSSAVCKLAAVVMGWDKAFGKIDQVEGKIDKHQAGWIEVDIKGRTLPEWQAFDLF